MRPKQALNRVFIVGLMGVGKTTIGKLLADALSLTFIDSDQEIEQRSGADISWIFDVEGEAGFRERETQVLEEITLRDRVLIATGGGVVLRSENRKTLRKRGLVIHLDADIEQLVARTAMDRNRPLLQGDDPAAVFQRLKSERDEFYESVRDIYVFLDDEGANKVVEELMGILRFEGLLHD